ncbi:transcriptional regulator [Pyrococcus furiosus DSM 3638]|uniref:DUF7343 domain-containing protein n=3 Tax=Pyrococcus furiosus TaxID=2261 RepID=Q8U222_PYRFU|nr:MULTISPECIES: MarR family transcriptional regulator [Pyrococcus]AAL81153.1 hypothetical protein PF1029 [Pyrococcus furiosus DSM 3638]AFN03825.1 hypothetical protein PFC_04380 [Pyrococcus furiosus COM1]MDK2868846.1 hypothetical protein [Pyrococcus sp.]QEK78692.1 transcriptional regulator [Pyrococcus furiosus DSM 3638]
MKKMLLLLMVLFFLISSPVSASYITKNFTLIVWKDNSITIDQTIIPQDYAIHIKVPTLSDKASNILVLSENGTVLPYIYSEGYITLDVSTLRSVRIVYTIENFSHKKGAVWYLNVSLEVPATIVFPNDTVIVSVSDIPIKLEHNKVLIGPGNITIYYTYESIIAPKNRGFTKYILMGVSLLLVFVFFTIRKDRKERKKKHFEDTLNKIAKEYNLNDEEVNALRFLLSMGGKASQSELRKALDLPKTTTWRMVKRLEQMGLIKVYKVGRENWIELSEDMQKLI